MPKVRWRDLSKTCFSFAENKACLACSLGQLVKTATAYIDGSGNSSRIQACATAIYVEGELDCLERTMLLPPNTTNNVGEYLGLLLAIRTALEINVEVLHIRSDSKLIVEQTRGNWRCKDHNLRILRDLAQKKALNFQEVSIEWIPREENCQADALCRAVIKAAEKKSHDNLFLHADSLGLGLLSSP